MLKRNTGIITISIILSALQTLQYSRGRVALGHPHRAVIGEPINGQFDSAKQFDILYKIMRAHDIRPLILSNFKPPVFCIV